MTTIKKLRMATEEVRQNYLDNIEKWANEQMKRNLERLYRQRRLTHRDNVAKNSEDKILVSYDEYYTEEKWVHNSPKWYFTEGLVSRSITIAEMHYEESLVKLCKRIEKKGLKGDLKISGARLEENFHLTITDGEKTVKAFTIIAEGIVQRPHYRFLVK